MNPNREELLFQLALSKPAAKRAAWLDAVRLREDASARQVRPTIKLDLSDAPDEAVGQALGRYKLLERIGEGGCGTVYVAEQAKPGRHHVPLKVDTAPNP
jgi:eukaryotic-like serine/threonine-protein kinase